MGNSARQKLRKLAAELDEMEKEMKKIDAEQADVARQLSVLKKSSIGYSSRLKDISSSRLYWGRFSINQEKKKIIKKSEGLMGTRTKMIICW